MRLFRWSRPLSTPDKIYSSGLKTLYLGRALWYPEPHESGEPQIGDVGYILEGAFIRLFNLNVSVPENAVMFWEPPFEITEPLPPGLLRIDRRRRPLAPDHYRIHGAERKEPRAPADL
ncbi:uncharacterized protein PHACADRAFT_248935 [Phanerochaete carnosa HHB-10118-sp]|uniref:Uncharacterized protein n=1 Tax=Phanerochaete carnosa (strain HHB-10118-sp) TaxID=650164 RepID=K5WIC9_PHACS|nr:uncharacterized protein PHACADRAFT_248935 [Phanerochaete carnosa HHB-10118-sp]EKM58839.1 hypothetical protein PHACADRAFT_248935 [Phanerochaete carnosa HHB-10118-sp]